VVNRVQAFLLHPGQEEMIKGLLARWLEGYPVIKPEQGNMAHQTTSAPKVLYHVATDILGVVFQASHSAF